MQNKLARTMRTVSSTANSQCALFTIYIDSLMFKVSSFSLSLFCRKFTMDVRIEEIRGLNCKRKNHLLYWSCEFCNFLKKMSHYYVQKTVLDSGPFPSHKNGEIQDAIVEIKSE